jgi:hypothetical protein
MVWAVVPLVALGVFEHVAFGTTYFGRFIRYRLMGAMVEGFDFEAGGGTVPVLHPLRLLLSPGLWSGLLAAAAFVVLAARLRRRREPI